MNEEKQPNVRRRNLLGLAAASSLLGALGLAASNLLRLPRPAVLPERSSRFEISRPGQSPPGTVREFPGGKFIVLSDDAGPHAISTVCTHLGRVGRWKEKGFECPCHGSKFDTIGKVIGGPAPKALPWLHIEQLANGRLAVDVSSPYALRHWNSIVLRKGTKCLTELSARC